MFVFSVSESFIGIKCLYFASLNGVGLNEILIMMRREAFAYVGRNFLVAAN